MLRLGWNSVRVFRSIYYTMVALNAGLPWNPQRFLEIYMK